ncbi:hypothetical protein HCN44_005842 [Aphidius gifuensis]|uniref:Odorant receptor n=1 Tax=Aphidius gifuensis TaxID=684658 RepID=A0A834XYB5_APHGI|nr:hypothetical protein HCN44_005842 [Aphidius gifuensis]
MKAIGPLSFCVMALSKYFLLVTRKKDIYNCFKHICHDWRRVQLINDENIMLENAGTGRFITIICAAFMYGGGFFYNTIMPFAVGSIVTADNKTIKPITYPVYDPLFSAQETPNYQIVFTLQWVSGFIMYSITIGACNLAAVFAFHACGQLKIVISRLDNFVDRNHNYDDVLKNKMGVIIELHLRTIRFILRVEDILNELNLIEFLGCTFNICMLVYYFMSVSFTFNIFIFCYIGEMLTQQGKKLGLAAYNNMNWYELTTKNSRGLILIMAMSNCPCSLTAENAGKGRFITIICAAFMYGGGFFYHTIMPFAVGSFVTSDNKTIKPLTYPVYDPLFSAQETPNYQIVFTLQWFAGFVMYSITIGACSLAAVFAFHACGQLKIVISRLDNFVDLNHNIDDVLKKKMADIIERHLRTLRFIVRVEEILNELNLIEFLGCTFNICMLVYYFMSISFTFNIFIFCYIGEMLTQQGLKVGWAAYNNINWYELSRKNSRGIILIMAISNNPCSLTAGKMTSLSYASFCSVIRSSMAYLNILRTVVL